MTYDGDASTAAIDPVRYWTTGYEDLPAAIWTEVGRTLSVTLAAQAGYEVSLFELVIAPYLNRTVDTKVTIVDLTTGDAVFDDEFEPLSTDGVTEISGTTWTSATGFRILFGPNAYDAGIGRITFTAQPIAAVPLPAAGFLMLGALGALFGLRRRAA